MERNSHTTINHLVSRFSDKSLPKSEWTHQAHIYVAIWHNKNHDFDTALELVKVKIKAYNIAVGTPNTEDSGYHETLTIFWMILTKRFLLQHPSLSMETVCDHFLKSEYASKGYPFIHYSKGLLFSKEARKRWINGDISPISLRDQSYQLNNHLDLSDKEFAQAFHDCSLSPSLFSHEAHLRLAWIYLKKYDSEKAISTVCGEIENYVDHLGARDKYHKTVTVAGVKIVHHFLQKSDDDDFYDFVLRFPRLKTSFKELIGSHYSFDIFGSEDARREYLAPDLLPFS